MLDDLRNSSTFIEDEEPAQEKVRRYRSERGQGKENFLGMTAQQRFIISVMLFLMVCVLGSFALVLSGSVALF